MAQMKRNGYIDITKFIFAILIMLFHFGSDVLKGGYLAVEGFFMITGFFMMKSVEKSNSAEPTGVSTVKFMYRKYKSLLPMLFVSAAVGFVLYVIIKEQDFTTVFKNFWLILFEIFPLQTAGFKDGYYVIGISWYLSSMFIALAILFPLAKKFKRNFVLVICPLLTVLCYGIIAAKYGMIGGVAKKLIEGTILQQGIIRALAGCSLGCILSEIVKKVGGCEYTKLARIVFTVLELSALGFIIYFMRDFYYSKFDFVVVILLFGMLIIGIGGLSYTSNLWNPKWAKHFGTASTLMVLNHCYWCNFIKLKLNDLTMNQKMLVYLGLVAVTCVVVFFLSKLLTIGVNKLLKKELWIKQPSN